jgi:c-di-GMP-binding flagellar brake protein YcgR
MYWPRLGERVLIEVLPPGETFTGEVREVGTDHLLTVSVPVRDPEVLLGDPTVRLTFVRKDGLYETSGLVQVVEPGEGEDTANLIVRLAEEAARTQRRDFIRRDASLNAELEWNGTRTRCVTKEVSGGGVSVLFPEPPLLAEGMEFSLALNLPDGREAIRARCRAKYVREILRGSRWLAGGQFVDITEEDRQRIVRFVFRLELAQKRPR